MPQTIGVPREVFPGERRVATVPDVVQKLNGIYGDAVVPKTGPMVPRTVRKPTFQAATRAAWPQGT